MKKIIFLTALCLTVFIVSANNYRDDDGRYKFEMKNTIEKTFSVDKNPLLDMNGKYSDFIITTWDQPQIDFKVNIVVKSDNEEKLRAKFNSISILLEQSGNTVTAETVFGEYKYKSFNGSMTIKYYVHVPADVAMDLQTKYGDIILDEANNKLDVEVKYGDFRADNITIDDTDKNNVDVKYGNINIDNVKKIEIVLDYGEAKINKCDYIDGTLRYSKIFITDLDCGSIENKYSTTRIEKANKIEFDNTAYSDMMVSHCTDKITADIKYSDLSVSMTSDSPVVLIDCSYSDAVVHLNESASFKYSFDTSYCDITFKGFFDTETISRTGSRGDGQQGRIEVDARYGDVKFYKNK